MFSFVFFLCAPLVAGRTVLVTGATGETGSAAYLWLKQHSNVTVRAFVRDVHKAASKLGCQKCDESEGIYVGDVTKKETLTAAMANVDAVLIAIGTISNSEEVFVDGTRNQIEAFATAPGPALQEKQIVKVSTMDTTKRWDGLLAPFFYHGVSDQDITVAGIPFTIVQPCGLGDVSKPAHTAKLLVSRDDLPFQDGKSGSVNRADVAAVVAYAAIHPKETVGLKFDLCADPSQKPKDIEEEEIAEVFKKALLPWDPRAKALAPPINV